MTYDNTPYVQRPLRRSRHDRMVAGVLGGLAQTYGWDATLLRVLFVASILLPGPQVLAYIAAAFLMKSE